MADCEDGVWRPPPRRPKPAAADVPVVYAEENGGNSLAHSLLAEAEVKDADPERAAAAAREDRKSLVLSIITLLISIPALIGAWCWPALVIGIVSGTVTAAARSLGHYISLSITSALMLGVGLMLFRGAAWGPRSWLEASRCRRYGPFFLVCIATPLIIADPLRHVLFDVGLWAGCSNNPTYNRVNSTNPFPSACYWSSYQYRCSVPCCVPTWLSTTDDASYAWFPPTHSFFPDSAATPQFATLRPNGTLAYPRGFNHSVQPYTVFEAPLALYETGTYNPGPPAALAAADCQYGVNPLTGYCFLTDQSLPYEQQLAQLPVDPVTKKPSCNCDQCNPSETMGNLAPLGVVFTIVFTYLGFGFLAVAVLWNANIVDKLKHIRTQWQELRSR